MSFRNAAFSTVVFVFWCLSTLAQVNTSGSSAGVKHNLRDAQHDFDFDIGSWKTHSSRLLHPLTGSTTWADMDGITVVKKVWDGRANLAEYKADGAAGHVELLALRIYNPEAHQWSLSFATPKAGTLSVPCIGEFKNGHGEFYDQEEINGKYILVRFSIWSTGPERAQSEQAFSDDGGKTWEVNWINKYTRVSDQTNIDWNTNPGPSAEQAGQHDFDFNFGVWHTHIQRILNPFSGASESMEINGTVRVRKVWGGRAQLEEIEAEGPNGHWEALTLFLYNPQSHQWNQIFANSRQGVLVSPLIGAFKAGRGELLNQDTFDNRSILVRGVWSDIEPNSHTYEEYYSDDGGQSWKPAFIGHLTRERE
jgi:BNR/Asp-box repeat